MDDARVLRFDTYIWGHAERKLETFILAHLHNRNSFQTLRHNNQPESPDIVSKHAVGACH